MASQKFSGRGIVAVKVFYDDRSVTRFTGKPPRRLRKDGVIAVNFYREETYSTFINANSQVVRHYKNTFAGPNNYWFLPPDPINGRPHWSYGTCDTVEEAPKGRDVVVLMGKQVPNALFYEIYNQAYNDWEP